VNGWWWLMKKNRLYYCVTPPTSSGNNYCGMESGARLYIGQIIGHDDDISWSRLLRDPWSASTRVGVGASQSPSAIAMVIIRSADPPLGCTYIILAIEARAI
jgi:hypothetical protein